MTKKVRQVYYCEICGAPVTKLRYYEVEGAIMVLCENCAHYGKPVSMSTVKRERRFLRRRESRNVAKPINNIFEWELVEDYGRRIREARERLGLTQEDLARLVSEPVSYIRKIERQKVYPSEKVIEKLEKVLKIKLKEQILSSNALINSSILRKSSKGTGLRLGDILIIRKDKKKKR